MNGLSPERDVKDVCSSVLVFTCRCSIGIVRVSPPAALKTAECLQGADNLAMRHSQHIETGKQIQVYSADMRRTVSLQFYPDGYELVEAEPTIISEGYSSHKVCHLYACWVFLTAMHIHIV